MFLQLRGRSVRHRIVVALLVVGYGFACLVGVFHGHRHPRDLSAPLPTAPAPHNPPTRPPPLPTKSQSHTERHGGNSSNLPVGAQPVRPQEQQRQKPQNPRAPGNWLEFFQPRSQQQFSLEYPYLYRAADTCREPVDGVVITLSRPKSHEERQAIRQTWGSVARNGSWPGVPRWERLPMRLRQVFLLGEDSQPSPNRSQALREENEKYGDLVQWKGMVDTYFNLTLKVLLGLKWVTEFCPNVSHVIKTDDDTFAHLQRLVHLLSNESTSRIVGLYLARSGPDRAGKYKVSQEAYPLAIYPPHVKGNLYVLPGKSVDRMVAVAPYLPYNNIEDVHVTGTVARAAGLSHRASKAREFTKGHGSPDPCQFHKNRVVLESQAVTHQQAFLIWKSFSGSQCTHVAE